MNKLIAGSCFVLAFTGLSLAQAQMASQSAPSFYKMQTTDLRASQIIGTDVYNSKNENIGEVEDILLGKNNMVQAVVLSVGGFLGVGDRLVAVKPEAVNVTMQSNNTMRILVNADKTNLQSAPEIDLNAKGANRTGMDNTTSTGSTSRTPNTTTN